MDSEFLPFPADVRAAMSESEITEADWETAYHNLWRVREQGIRPDYPYVEPDGYDAIIAEAAPEPPWGPCPTPSMWTASAGRGLAAAPA